MDKKTDWVWMIQALKPKIMLLNQYESLQFSFLFTYLCAVVIAVVI